MVALKNRILTSRSGTPQSTLKLSGRRNGRAHLRVRAFVSAVLDYVLHQTGCLFRVPRLARSLHYTTRTMQARDISQTARHSHCVIYGYQELGLGEILIYG